MKGRMFMKEKQRGVMSICMVLAVVIGIFVAYPLHTQAKTTVKSIQLNISKKTMYIGQRVSLKVKKVTPSKASAAVTWSSSDENVAIVTQTGVVTAKNLGTVKITAVSKSNKKVKKQCTITVTENGAIKHSGISKKISWKIYENGLLSVTGSGSEGMEASWIDYKDDITYAKVELQDVTDLSCMFKYLCYLKKVDLSGLDTSKVEDMSEMFYDCASLKSVDISNFDTSKVKDMSRMFFKCRSLKTIDVSKFDTSKVENMSGMFYNCINLKKLDLSTWNTGSLKKMGSDEDDTVVTSTDEDYLIGCGMFSNCKSLKVINLANFDTSKVTDMGYLFYGCQNLRKVDVSRFNTKKVSCMSGMFYGCKNLKAVKLDNFNTSCVYLISSMFKNCEKLEQIDVSNFDTTKVRSISSMFSGCQSLKTLDLSNFDLVNMETSWKRTVVDGCKNLQTILTPKRTGKVTLLLDNEAWIDNQGTEYMSLRNTTESFMLTRKVK